MSVYIDTRTDAEILAGAIVAWSNLAALAKAGPENIDIIGTEREFDADGAAFVVDTCSIADLKTYETAVKHSRYNDGNWIIVGNYTTREEAERKHKSWTEYFKTNCPCFIEDSHTGVRYLRDVVE